MNGNVMLFVSSFGWVTAVAVPVIVVAWWMSRRSPPRKQPFPVTFSGIDVILLTFALIFADAISYAIVSQPTVVKWLVPAHLASEATAGLDLLGGLMIAKAKQSEVTRIAAIGLFARLLSATLAVLIVIGRYLAMDRLPLRIAGPSTIWYSGVAWLVIAPIVLTISAVVSQMMTRWGDVVEVHPLSTIGGEPSLTLVFLVSACVATPIFEELIVRGVVLPWAVADHRRSLMLFLPAALFAVMGAKNHMIGVACFLIATAVLMGIFLITHRDRPDRDERAAILATSVLFAGLHSQVWPTPIPLFVFSIGLGWLAIRTGGVMGPIIVHGLLNAVSAIYVLRGGTPD